MQQLHIVNLSNLLFCLASEWEATNLKKTEEAYETINMEIRWGKNNNETEVCLNCHIFVAKSMFALCVLDDASGSHIATVYAGLHAI